MKNLLKVAVFAILSTLAKGQDFSYLCRPDVQAAISDLRALSGTLTHVETAIQVLDDGTLQRSQGVRDAAAFTPNPHAVAVLHNHPFNDVHPSRHDVGLAHQLGIPVFVVTRDEVWVGTPEGKVFQSDGFKTLTLYTQDPEGPPAYGRQHFFSMGGLLGR